MTQQKLQYWILGFMAVVVVVGLFFLRDVRIVSLSILIALFLVLLPFRWDPFVRSLFTPFIDSINERIAAKKSERITSDNFPLWMRVMIWAFMGIVMSLVWSWLAPTLLSLPLPIGKLAMDAGWKTLAATDGKWQYVWTLVFLGQYLANFFIGIMKSFDTFKNHFRYPGS